MTAVIVVIVAAPPIYVLGWIRGEFVGRKAGFAARNQWRERL